MLEAEKTEFPDSSILPLKPSGSARFATMSLDQLRQELDLQLGASAGSPQDLQRLLAQVMAHSVSTDSPFFMNQLFSGVVPEAIEAAQVIAQTRTTMSTFEASSVFTAIELEVIQSLGEKLGWQPQERDGIGVPGGSAANIMAVHVARQQKVPEFRHRGSSGERFKIFASTEAHYSMRKACLATGLGTDALVGIAVDASGRMQVEELRRQILQCRERQEIPLLVCATAGTTVLGAFDPLEPIADICREFGIWLHVDAAWGGPVIFSESLKPLVNGIQRADSVAMDAHKLLGMTMTCSFFLCRHRGLLFQANDVDGGGYLFHEPQSTPDLGRLSWQCGRSPEAFGFWWLWKKVGDAGFSQRLNHGMLLQQQTLALIEEFPRLTLVASPQYLNVCFRVKSPYPEESDGSWSLKVREALKRENFAFINYSSNAQGPFLRLILAHPELQISHLKKILQRSLELR